MRVTVSIYRRNKTETIGARRTTPIRVERPSGSCRRRDERDAAHSAQMPLHWHAPLTQAAANDASPAVTLSRHPPLTLGAHDVLAVRLASGRRVARGALRVAGREERGALRSVALTASGDVDDGAVSTRV